MWLPASLVCAVLAAGLLLATSGHALSLADLVAADSLQRKGWSHDYLEGDADLDYPAAFRGLGDRELTSIFSSKATEPLSSSLQAESGGESRQVWKREGGHSLSIVHPLDVLRQRMLLESARRRLSKNQHQIRENALLLNTLGKRTSRRDRVPNSEELDV